MRSKGMSVCLFLLTVTMLAGCGSKAKGTAEGDPAKQSAVAKGDLPKVSAVGKKSPSATKGGNEATMKKGGAPIEAATDLTRLEHKGFVIFYKGFTEDQMKAYLDHIYKHWGKGKNDGLNSDGVFYYQVKLAKQNQGMRIVREDDFTRIMFPVDDRMKNSKIYFRNIALPLWSLGKIDESVKGKIAYATCNDDCTAIYTATDKFNRR